MYSGTHPITLFLKNFLSKVSSNPLTITLSRVIYAPQAGCITIPLHYLKNYTPIFEHRLLPLINDY